MTTGPDYATPEMQVRLIIADLSTDTAQIFDDAQITGFLTLEGDVVKLAAATALDTIASNEALVGKVLKTQDQSTDGAKVADALRKHAAELRHQVAESDTAADEGYFEIVDFDPYPARPELTEGG